MKTFNFKLFGEELKKLRDGQTQEVFAEQLGINRSTLSLLENGKQYPTIEQLNFLCEKRHVDANAFFTEKGQNPVMLMMGNMSPEDRTELARVMERIRIKKTYRELQQMR